jgi:hypothetical protein
MERAPDIGVIRRAESMNQPGMTSWMARRNGATSSKSPDVDMIGDENRLVRENMKILNRSACR